MPKKSNLFPIIIGLLLLSGCSTDANKDLTCTSVAEDGTKYIVKSSFENGKRNIIDWTIIMPNSSIEDPEKFEIIFNKINKYEGCSGTFTRNTDGTYTTREVCDLNKMTDEDVKSVYMQERKGLEQTRKQILEQYNVKDEELKNSVDCK